MNNKNAVYAKKLDNNTVSTNQGTRKHPMKALLVVAARPNFIKIQPVLGALEKANVECVLVHTGQHYTEKLSDAIFSELGIRKPDEHLGVGSGTQAEQIGKIMMAFEPVLEHHQPNVVVVVGDVNSTMACALVAARSGVMVVHVESGLRSRDWSMPEEINRVVTDRVCDLLLAPCEEAMSNLRSEGYREDQLALVGNVMIDTLMSNIERARNRPILTELSVRDIDFGLVTLHRPSNVDDPVQLGKIIDTLNRVSDDLPLIFPVHPRTRVQLDACPVSANITLTEPLGYLDFISLEASARLVLTDSGGVQEETTVLGVPCITLRDSTERPITVTEGTNQVVGSERRAILKAVEQALKQRGPARRPALWDGKAGKRCADAILNKYNDRARLRPTDLFTEAASELANRLEHAL